MERAKVAEKCNIKISFRSNGHQNTRVTKKEQFVMRGNKKERRQKRRVKTQLKNKYFLEKGKQLKNADNGKTGAIRSGLARTPRSVRL